MASFIVRRESGSSDRTVQVISGGEVVATKKVSGEEFKRTRRSSGGRSRAEFELARQAVDEIPDPISAVSDPVRRQSRRLTPLEDFSLSAQGRLVSTEQGTSVLFPQESDRVSRVGVEDPNRMQSRIIREDEFRPVSTQRSVVDEGVVSRNRFASVLSSAGSLSGSFLGLGGSGAALRPLTSRLTSVPSLQSRGEPVRLVSSVRQGSAPVSGSLNRNVRDTAFFDSRPVSSVSPVSERESRGLRRSNSFFAGFGRGLASTALFTSPSTQQNLIGSDVNALLRSDLSLRDVSRIQGRGRVGESIGGALGLPLGVFGASRAARGTRAVGVAEFNFLRGISNPFVRTGAAIGLTSAEGALIGAGSRQVDRLLAPAQLRPFVSDNAAFRAGLSAELQAEPNFVRRQLAGLNVGFSRQEEDFGRASRDFLREQGFSGSELDLRVDALEFRRSRAPRNELVSTLNAGRFAEVFGRANLGRVNFASLNRRQAFGAGFRNIFPAGVAEVRGELASTRARQGSDLPFIGSERPFRSLLPEVSFNNGFSVQSRSRLGQDLGLGLLGGGTAALLGGAVASGSVARSGVGRAQGRAANIFGNVLDPSEVFTDFLAFDVGLTPNIGVSSLTPNLVPSSSPVPSRSFAPASFSPAPFSQRVVPSLTNPRNNFFSQVFGSSRTSPMFPVFSPVRSSPLISSIQPSPNIGVPPVSPQPSPIVPAQSFAPATSINVPATSFLPRFPVTLPFSFDLGGSGFGGRNSQRVSFVNELDAALRVANFRGRRFAFPDPLAGFMGGRRG